MAQTMVTEFFNSRKRAYDSDLIKRLDVEQSISILGKSHLSEEEVIPAKKNKIEEKTTKSTPRNRGLRTENIADNVELLEKLTSSFDENSQITPKSSQSICNIKTPKRLGSKKNKPNQNSKPTPKRRKLILSQPVHKQESIKSYFSQVSSKESVESTSSSLQASKPELDEIKVNLEVGSLEKEIEMVKTMTSVPKQISPLPVTPTKKTVVAKPVNREIKGTNLETKLNAKPSIDNIKAQLKSCGKLQELKKCLFKINLSASKLKDINAKKDSLVTAISPIKIPSPSKSPAKAPLYCFAQEIQKNPEVFIKAPAYERFHNLATDEQTNNLALPFKYKTLAEFFRCLDTVVCMLYNRKEICTFEKIKASIQQMIKRMFDKTKLGQIKTVFPLAYIYSLENVSKFISKSNSGLKTLVITPNMDYNNKSRTKKIMDPTTMAERKAVFHKHLVEITKKHHEVFLSGLNPPLQVNNDQIIRWHPKFPIDEVPDIEPSSLPEDTQEKVQTAQDVLEKMKIGSCPRVERALQIVKDSKTEMKLSESPKKNEVPLKALKGISQSIIDKIRAKEAAKMLQEMLRNPESEKRLSMLNRLAEFASILRSYFIQEKRAAIVMDDAVAKLFESYHTSISQIEVEDHIKLLAKVLPNWLSLIQIRKGVFLKIDKSKDLGVLNQHIQDAIKKEKGI